MPYLFSKISCTAALIFVFFSGGPVSASTCAPTQLPPLGAGESRTVTYSGTLICEGYDTPLDVPDFGGTFGISLVVQSDVSRLNVFQVFNDHNDFYDLFVDGAPTPWKSVIVDRYIYQMADVSLFTAGNTYQIELMVTGAATGPGRDATVRIGNVIPAIPAPASVLLVATGLMAFAGIGRRKRRQERTAG